jgi:hypothetical protein
LRRGTPKSATAISSRLKTTDAVRANQGWNARITDISRYINNPRDGYGRALMHVREGRTDMKTKLMILGLLAGSSMFAATHFSIGVGIGAPAPVYTAPAYGYSAPGYGYGYAAPAYGYGYNYVAPRYEYHDRDWDRNHYRRDRDHDRDDRGRERNEVRRDWRR